VRRCKYASLSLGFFLAIGVALGRDEGAGAKRVDLQYGASLNLQTYSGPNVDIIVRGREMSTIKFSVADYDHPVASVTVTGLGTTPIDYSPAVTNHTLTLGLENAIPVGSFQSRNAYLMYRFVGVDVYWFDAIDTSQNTCALLIAPAIPGSKK
jgi:hypothetical protein